MMIYTKTTDSMIKLAFWLFFSVYGCEIISANGSRSPTFSADAIKNKELCGNADILSPKKIDPSTACQHTQDRCPPHTYGCGCQFICGHCQYNASCNSSTGLCLGDVCETGWNGRGCQLKCPGYTYGDACKNKCGNCRYGQPCDHVTGDCKNCASGWTGRKCDGRCGVGYFGENCARKCHCFGNFTCSSETGSCGHHGCSLGWQGEHCDIQKHCLSGQWGKDCTECGACINPQCADGECITNCDGVTGSCPRGCQRHWQGQRCDVCVDKRYGRRCEYTCGHCYRGYTCHVITGWCGFIGCDEGYMGNKCDLQCREGRYGYECSMRCSGNCLLREHCLFTNGSCLSGCVHGWKGDRCNIPICTYSKNAQNFSLCGMRNQHYNNCLDGWWGDDCKKQCGRCTNHMPCDKITGDCPKGCMGKFVPPQCTVCPKGMFGYECDKQCGHCKGTQFCESITGGCPDGCAERFTGNICATRIPEINVSGVFEDTP